MSGGGGGGNNSLLDTAIMVGAGIAAPKLAPMLFEGGTLAGSTALATGVTGALTGAVGGALTGQSPVQTALVGGAGGALSGAMGPAAQVDPNVAGTAAIQSPSLGTVTPEQIAQNVSEGNMSIDTANKYGQAYTDAFKNYQVPSSGTNFFGQSLAGGSPTNMQLGTAGIMGLLNTQGIGPKYGVPSNIGATPDSPLAHYNAYSAKGVQYPTSFANGGMVPMTATYPQNQVTTNRFANASQTPVSVSPFRTTSDVPPFSAQTMASGGVAETQLQKDIDQTIVNPFASRGYASGGISDLGSYSDGGRMLEGPGDGMSDDIPASIGVHQPARLADGEFVVPADVVSHLGNGSTDAGAKQLYSMMDKVRQARTGTKKQGKQINPSKFMPTKGYADGGTTTSAPATTAPATTAAPATTTSDASTAPQYSNQDLVSLYQNVLGRAPDQAGYNYWNQQMQNGASLGDINKQFLGTQEYTENPAAQTNYQNIVNQALTSDYQNLLNRNPDAPGMGYWSKQAMSGVPLSQIEQSLAASPEAQASPAGQANYAQMTGPQMTNKALEAGSGVAGNSFFFNPMTGRYETNAGATMIAPKTPATTSSTSAPDANAYQGQGAQSAAAQAKAANDPSQFYNDPGFQAYMKQQYANYQNPQYSSGGASGGLAALIAKRK